RRNMPGMDPIGGPVRFWQRFRNPPKASCGIMTKLVWVPHVRRAPLIASSSVQVLGHAEQLFTGAANRSTVGANGEAVLRRAFPDSTTSVANRWQFRACWGAF